jgi:hypothetical protein
MSSLTSFNHHFFQALLKIRAILFGLLVWHIINAVAIAYVEKMALVDAVYFTFITGLAIGYGDLTPVTIPGKAIAVLTGLLGLLTTGLITAVAVFALRKSMEPPGKSH